MNAGHDHRCSFERVNQVPRSFEETCAHSVSVVVDEVAGANGLKACGSGACLQERGCDGAPQETTVIVMSKDGRRGHKHNSDLRQYISVQPSIQGARAKACPQGIVQRPFHVSSVGNKAHHVLSAEQVVTKKGIK